MKLNKIVPWLLFLALISGIGIVAYKIFNPKMHTITFNTNNGEIIENMEIRDNSYISNLPKITKENYEFQGWYLNDLLFDTKTPINEDITLVAKWHPTEIEMFNIVFDTLGGNEISSITVNKGTILDSVPEPIKEGFSFQGWYYHNKPFDLKTAINSNLTLIAKWN